MGGAGREAGITSLLLHPHTRKCCLESHKMAFGSHHPKKNSSQPLNRNRGSGRARGRVRDSGCEVGLKKKNLEKARKGSRNKNNQRELISVLLGKSKPNKFPDLNISGEATGTLLNIPDTRSKEPIPSGAGSKDT